MDKTPTTYKRARSRLNVRALSESELEVTGGKSPHIVKMEGDSFVCDCAGYGHPDVMRCSHIWRVVMLIDPLERAKVRADIQSRIKSLHKIEQSHIKHGRSRKAGNVKADREQWEARLLVL